jgi:hypothetical protein
MEKDKCLSMALFDDKGKEINYCLGYERLKIKLSDFEEKRYWIFKKKLVNKNCLYFNAIEPKGILNIKKTVCFFGNREIGSGTCDRNVFGDTTIAFQKGNMVLSCSKKWLEDAIEYFEDMEIQ